MSRSTASNSGDSMTLSLTEPVIKLESTMQLGAQQSVHTALQYITYTEAENSAHLGAFSALPHSKAPSLTLSLTEPELKLPPWKQMTHNGALDPTCITKTKLSLENSIVDNEFEQESYFSDDELSTLSEDDDHPHSKTTFRHVLELREYQKELAENALKGENTIICAPTGSGKTRVATFIIQEHFHQLVKEGRKPKVAFFAKTVPLAFQQYKALSRYLPNYEMTCITGQSGEPKSLHLLLKDSDVIVMTPQILQNHLEEKLLPHLGVFSMLVFDECHHTRNNDPYSVLMIDYLRMKTQAQQAVSKKDAEFRLPQIIGLTATIGVDKAKNENEAVQNILKVCGNLDADNLSSVRRNLTQLKQLVPVPEEKIKLLVERNEDKSVELLEKNMAELETRLTHYIREMKESGYYPDVKEEAPYCSRKSSAYEQWAVSSRNKFQAVAIHDPHRETHLAVRLSIIILEYLIAYRSALETFDLVELEDIIEYLDRCFLEYSHDSGTYDEKHFYKMFTDLKNVVRTREGEQNPNLRTLAKVLMTYLVRRGDKSRGIIFVRTRALAEALSHWLNRCGIRSLQDLKACSFTGSNVSEDKGGTSQAQQEAIIHRFRSGDIRLIVATSVAEEGLDIPDCNLIVKYNHVGTEVTTVQTKGRSRAFGGISYLLAMPDIFKRERINQHRLELMMEAFKIIQNMSPDDFKKATAEQQKELLQQAIINDLLQKQTMRQYVSVPFRMVCRWCRKLSVSSSHVKIVAGSHRVSIDRSLLDHIQVIVDKNPKMVGDCLLVGVVYCKSVTEEGSVCQKKVGRIIKHQKIPYMSLSVKYFAFDTGDNTPLGVYKKWKEVPYEVQQLTFDDIERYLREVSPCQNPKSPICDDDDDDSSDEEN